MVKRVCLEFLVLSQNSEIDSEDRCFFPSKTLSVWSSLLAKRPFSYSQFVLRCKKLVSCWMVWVLNFSGRLGGFWETRDFAGGRVGWETRRPVGLKTAFFPCFFGRSEILEPEETICDYFCSMSEFNINIKGGNTLGWWLDRIKRRPFGLSIWGDNESTTIRVCYFLKFPLLDGKTVDCWMVAK